MHVSLTQRDKLFSFPIVSTYMTLSET